MSDWLRAQGFALVDVPDNHLFVTASGTVAQVEHAFQVNESLYQVSGQTVRAPDANPRIPDDLAASVTAITGLDNAYALARPQHQDAGAAAARPAPRSAPARTTGVSTPAATSPIRTPPASRCRG